MKIIKAILGVILTCLIIYLGNTKIGQLPPIIKFIEPYHGFWQNAEILNKKKSIIVRLEGLQSESQV
ncbi:MAG: penicillin amidase, partial [Polaribacter sp.]